ncbi:hydantoinase B/oxoprolinase family protein [Spirulina major]|uniref:hydantoinase B/oxoprolinase family protein n=1 Tax=Spirulina major TaxID=270636 RepID=UPI000934A9D1|nr:hydantoinase B/oxoprolinase family protein [Spirulina major]
MTPRQTGWQFWIDRGGTFTDIVAQRPDGRRVVHKLLSENPERYADAPIQGMREVLGLGADEPLPIEQIDAIKMGTTVATNALLERKGDRTLFVTTQGFKDVLRIGYQNRPDIFARQIVRPSMLYAQVIEVAARHDAQGRELIPLNEAQIRQDLQTAYDRNIRSCAVALLHGYRNPAHEQRIGAIAREIGFTHISLSHQVSPLMKLVSRGDTTVVDAYLSPILRRYVDRIAAQLHTETDQAMPRLMFMQSNGGLTAAQQFQGKDSILSGPAGGIVGAVKTCAVAGFDRVIGFDMGGTSTDVSHYAGEYERSLETEIAGVRLRSPMLAIHTVAAGGGSIVQYDGARYRVGPDSAGANPGPAAYGRGGPLTVTDCNVRVGKVQPDFFPAVFGPDGDRPLDRATVAAQFDTLAAEINDDRSPAEIATGFLHIAVNTMANAIKKISLQRGYDLSGYTLCCFGGAGGQHACLIAEALGMRRIVIHPYAGVLSAYGIGLADVRVIHERAVEAPLTEELIPELGAICEELAALGCEELRAQNTSIDHLEQRHTAQVKYQGTDSTLTVDLSDRASMIAAFNDQYRQRYGFTMSDRPLIIESLSVELIAPAATATEPPQPQPRTTPPQPLTTVPLFTAQAWQDAPVFQRDQLQPDDAIAGPALIIEATGTNVIEPGWRATVNAYGHLVIELMPAIPPDKGLKALVSEESVDPVLLEIFNHGFRAIAEQMGTTLQNTSYSVNIKERLDFSCALFDPAGQLVANAPHIPVHLGSMSASIESLIAAKGDKFQPGDVYLLNNPYNGGTHLPDVTVITPIFLDSERPAFYVASRGHHADIGGISPGSMPPHSTHIDQEGVLFDNVRLVNQGQFCEADIVAHLTAGPYPARNPDQNLADLRAQIAANEKGGQELRRMVSQYGQATVQAYMGHVQRNAEESVRRAIAHLQDGEFTCPLDHGAQIQVKITIHPQSRSATIDFTGTSPQVSSNFNAPIAVCQAAVLYVFRSLVDDDIPLNVGCLTPLTIIVPPGSLLNPRYPAAVVAGNVETSQAVVDCLYGALGQLAASQGTMNNFTFGNDQYQYYETICGGSGAGPGFAGTDAVQTHMTNSRLTDPEVLEWRFPVRLERFAIRPGSGGAGAYPGGNGVIRRVRFLEPMTAGILSGRRRVAPFGLAGGGAGQTGHNWIERADGTIEELGSTATIAMQAGDCLAIATPGGGGYGSM